MSGNIAFYFHKIDGRYISLPAVQSGNAAFLRLPIGRSVHPSGIFLSPFFRSGSFGPFLERHACTLRHAMCSALSLCVWPLVRNAGPDRITTHTHTTVNNLEACRVCVHRFVSLLIGREQLLTRSWKRVGRFAESGVRDVDRMSVGN